MILGVILFFSHEIMLGFLLGDAFLGGKIDMLDKLNNRSKRIIS